MAWNWRRAWLPIALGLWAVGAGAQGAQRPLPAAGAALRHRWLFVWRDLSDAKEVDRVIARLPDAAAAGYNGVALSAAVNRERAPALREAARRARMDLVAIVMGGCRDRNYMEGLPVRDALFVARGGAATLAQDNPTKIVNGDFEDASGNHMRGWAFQDDEGVTTFADHQVVHGGRTSLRMESIGKNQYRHCRIMQPLKLQPYRQYHVSLWVRTRDLSPADPEVKVLTPDTGGSISFQTFHVDRTQDWKRCDIVFNSMEHAAGGLYVGSWGGRDGALWIDDLQIEEIGLVNVLRRPGCPVTVRGEDGAAFEEGRDFLRIVDPNLHPWIAYHDQPAIRLTPGTRVKEGQRLRVGYYHPVIVYEDRLNCCISEPKVFDDWAAEVRDADALLRPAAFLMSHDEMRVMNRCAACLSHNMTAGELLAWNVHRAAAIIRAARPDAGIWVWNDMFDPMHNALDHYYAVNGSLKGSWKGLDRDVGIVNWHGGLKGKNCAFFAELGLRQILSGYYDGDEDGAGIAEWIAATRSVPGIVGAMYTTWEDRYAAMTAWARRAWGAAKLP